MPINQWMSWEGGVDLVAASQAGLAMPNIIVHVARMVHTPVGSAPSGLICYQPDLAGPPAVLGFVTTDVKVGAFFGPAIFAGTPFEKAPVLRATIEVVTQLPDAVSAKVVVGSYTFETTLRGLGKGELVHRLPGPLPFAQQGLEHAAGAASLVVNGKPVSLIIPPVGISGGPAAVFSPCGIYAR